MSRFIRKSYLSFCFADMLNYGISLILCPHFLWKLFWKKALLHNPDMYGDLRRTVNFAGKLLRIRSSRQWRDRCLSLIWHKKSSRVKHSNESWNWFFKSSMPGALSTVLENVRPRFSQPDWLPLGLRRYNGNSQHRKESGFFYCGLASNLNISSADLQWYLGIQPSVWSVFYKFLTTLMEFFMMQYQSKSPAMWFSRYSSFWKIFNLALGAVRPRLQTSRIWIGSALCEIQVF